MISRLSRAEMFVRIQTFLPRFSCVYRSVFHGRASMLSPLPQGPVRCGPPALPGGRYCPQVPAGLAVRGKTVLYCSSKNIVMGARRARRGAA